MGYRGSRRWGSPESRSGQRSLDDGRESEDESLCFRPSVAEGLWRQLVRARAQPPMSAAYGSHRSSAIGRMYWLPPWGVGNGLDSEAWAVIADIEDSQVRVFLDALREAGIPAYAARQAGHGLDAPFRLWVGTWYYSRAENVLGRALQRWLPPRADA